MQPQQLTRVGPICKMQGPQQSEPKIKKNDKKNLPMYSAVQVEKLGLRAL